MSATPIWDKTQIPILTGKTALVTGGNSGLGYEISLALAEKGAHVVMACRNMDKANQAAAHIRNQVATASLAIRELNLSELASVRRFAHAYEQQYPTLDLLINNAGIMAIPARQTADGFEMQLGTNHLGHFALTGLLLGPLMATPGARVVTVSSGLHENATMNFTDLMGKQGYDKWKAYGQSKLANLLFAYELQRKFAAAGVNAISVGAHPGYAATNLQSGGESFIERMAMALGNRLIAQSATTGARPILYAATATDVRGCDYIGPTGFQGMRGAPGKMRSNAASYHAEIAAKLWDVSRKLTGVAYHALQGQELSAT